MRIKNLPSIESMNGSQDALVIEQTDGSEDKSRKVSPAQIKQYVLGNSIDDIYSVMGQMGAKNLIPYPYYRASGYSSNGMTITYDSDGVLTINKVAGSSAAYFSFINNDQDYCFKPNTEYKLLFELENANQLTIYLKYGDADIVLINKKSTGKYVVNFTTPQTLQGRENLAINAAASDTETNAKVKVMIMLASDTDNTYQPYAKTNKQLTDELDTAREQIAQLNDDLVATRTNITPQTGVNADNNNKCYYEKVAGVVNVVINVKQLTAGTVSRICTLPAGYRPYAKITSAADNAGTGTGRAFVNVDASGNVDAYTSATQYVSGQLTFVAYS